MAERDSWISSLSRGRQAGGVHSDRNLIGGAPDTRNLLHPATLRPMSGTLHQCRAGIGHSGPGRHTDWVRGRGRGGAGGGGCVGLASIGPTQRFHLDELIPDFGRTQRNNECDGSGREVQSPFEEEMYFSETLTITLVPNNGVTLTTHETTYATGIFTHAGQFSYLN